MRHTGRALWLSATSLAFVAACSPQQENDVEVLAQGTAAEGSELERGTVAAGPFQLRYQIEGTGKPTIVFSSSIYLPRAFSENLRQHLRMVFLDHRAYAPSPGPVDISEFAEDKFIDDVERARQQLGLGRIVIMGHSINSIRALEYAKKYPENVSHLVMIGSPRLGKEDAHLMERYWEEMASPERKAALEKNRKALPDEELARLPPQRQFVRRYLREGPRTWYDPHFDASPLWEGVEQHEDYGKAVPFRRFDIEEGLDSLELPVFLALGRYDFRVAPPASWEDVRPKFRDLTFKVFEKSGHWPHYEESAAFDSALLEWLAERQ